jgi:transcriptional regulator with XRE-family HTH domain
MVIGERLKTLRETKNLSQGDIEKRTGLLRCDKPPAPPKSIKDSTENSVESSRSGSLLMKKMTDLLAKMDQEDRNLFLFLAGRVSNKRGGEKAGRKPASGAAA